MPLRALIVDDDLPIRELVRAYLAGFNIEADGAAHGQAMRELLARQRYDILILDLMLPGEDGLSLCREIRQSSDLPILMLTARGEAADRILGLELGADDYLVKPFEPRELVARIHAILRRGHSPRPAVESPPAPTDEHLIRFNQWSVHTERRQLTSPDGLLIPLSNAEFRLLMGFLAHPRRVLSRERLLDLARGRAMEVFDRSIDLLVSRLRQKLGDDPKNPTLIQTVRGEGYLFDAKVAR